VSIACPGGGKQDMKPRPLSSEMIRARVMRRLKRYSGKSLLEHIALFMGGVQLLELHHKGLLANWYRRDLEAMERWTLGRTARELRSAGVRPDYCHLLESLVEKRNFVVHELLASETLQHSIVRSATGRSARKILDPATYELEQLFVLALWCDKHGGLGLARSST
jgi:hypothetical protein